MATEERRPIVKSCDMSDDMKEAAVSIGKVVFFKELVGGLTVRW